MPFALVQLQRQGKTSAEPDGGRGFVADRGRAVDRAEVALGVARQRAALGQVVKERASSASASAAASVFTVTCVISSR